MINLVPFTGNTFEVFTEILQSKNPHTQATLSQIEAELSAQFELYNSAFNSNNLEEIEPLDTTPENKTYLTNLYTSRGQKIRQIKSHLLTAEENRRNNTCQYCTLNAASTLDHILPKNEFSEFSVNFLNLFPSCYECNNIKGTTWLKETRRQFLNLYTDILPQVQYLFVEVDIVDGVPLLIFSLRNEGRIDSLEFDLISRHYGNLHLFERFTLASNNVITNLANSIKALPQSMSDDDVVTFVKDSVENDKEHFGPNFWKSIVETTLVDNGVFMTASRLR